jgi:agmatinase
VKIPNSSVLVEEIIQVRPGFGGFDFSYDRADVVFIGVPLDITSSYRSGYRTAPARIREASANLETYLPSFRLDVFERLNISDLGDLIITPTDLEATGQRITKTVEKVRRDGKLPILLGGEHTLTYFSLKAFEDVFVIHLDAHRDLRNEYLGDRLCHATVMRRILDNLPSEKLLQVGIRSCSKEEAEFAEKTGLRTHTSEELITDPRKVMKSVTEVAGDNDVYLTIDLDVLDPAFAPGVATPEPGGPSTVELLGLVRELGELKILACDIVELVPPHDNWVTAFAAAKIAYEILGAISRKR